MEKARINKLLQEFFILYQKILYKISCLELTINKVNITENYFLMKEKYVRELNFLTTLKSY